LPIEKKVLAEKKKESLKELFKKRNLTCNFLIFVKQLVIKSLTTKTSAFIRYEGEFSKYRMLQLPLIYFISHEKCKVTEKYRQQSLPMAIKKQESDQFQNPFFGLVLDMENTSEPNFKSVGAFL